MIIVRKYGQTVNPRRHKKAAEPRHFDKSRESKAARAVTAAAPGMIAWGRRDRYGERLLRLFFYWLLFIPRSSSVPGIRLSQNAAQIPATAIGVFMIAQTMPPMASPNAPANSA